ncbi:glycosyl hydrolase 115 family protein [Mucilaginibacter sp. HD30]
MKRKYIKSKLLIALSLLVGSALAQGPGHASYVAENGGAGYFQLAANGSAAPILVSDNEWPGVKRAVNSFITDVKAVTGITPALAAVAKGKQIVIVGTLGKNQWIDQLVKQKKLNVADIAGKWETYLVQPVANPFPGVSSALVIAGSDKRGTIFGVYDMSAQIGVSPWYWYADVAPKTKKAIYVAPGRHTDGTPAVKYRGIFINDEAPAFSGWAKEKFGGVNHQLYEHMFELILRMKGNFLWPAMWANAFNDDDKLNPILADEYGIVMSTSHHEPMDRAQQEWKRYGKGEWNYEKNKEGLKEFWRKGIENMGNKETVVTLAMRGDGDAPMTQGANISLLENIVKDQREIIGEVMKKDVTTVPQVWALYKEVQDYYDKGMRVPDDVTLLLCDDNWGNIRKLPAITDKPRKGGYGIYYHFDYVGGPRNYKWLNTSTISKTWQQMNLAYEYNARQIWVVNVGDLKPMEYPISFFLDFAWNPKRWPANKLPQYAVEWAKQQFGAEHATQIASMLIKYTRYNERRKPESLDQNTYSLTNYNEGARVVADYNKLKDEAEKLAAVMPKEHKDSFYELVLYPIQACATLNEMYFEVAKNRYYAQQKNGVEANKAADRVKELYAKDAEISKYYNTVLADGKWNHMADQQHIGYNNWQQPVANKMPALTILNPDSARNTALLPVESDGSTPKENGLFSDKNGHIAIEAEHYTKAVAANNISWTTIPDYGLTLSGVMALPVTAPRITTPGGASPHLEYDINVKQAGDVAVTAFIGNTLDFKNGGDGLFYAISIDDDAPQRVDVGSKVDGRDWTQMVLGNARKITTKHKVAAAGKHTIKYWFVDPAVVLQRVVVDTGGLKQSYLGPKE